MRKNVLRIMVVCLLGWLMSTPSSVLAAASLKGTYRVEQAESFVQAFTFNESDMVVELHPNFSAIDFSRWLKLMQVGSSPLTGMVDPTEAPVSDQSVKELLQAKLDSLADDVTLAEALFNLEAVRSGLVFHMDAVDANPYFHIGLPDLNEVDQRVVIRLGEEELFLLDKIDETSFRYDNQVYRLVTE